jgi:hypothetical protein
MEYAYIWHNESSPGYICYRKYDGDKIHKVLAMMNRVCAFVCEEDAKEYCEFKNNQLNQ